VLDQIGVTAEPRRIGEAAHAVQLGRESLAAGDRKTASRWLDRSFRLAPDNPSVALLLASSLVGIDDARADNLLTALIDRQPACREALIALSASRLRSGQVDHAVELLGLALSRVAPPADPMFSRFADAVVQEAGAPGWVGLDARGRLHLSANLATRPAALEFRLDGRAVLPMQRSAGGWRLPRLWATRAELAVTADGAPVLGSPIDVTRRARVEGFIEVGDGGCISGWGWFSGDPDTDPVVSVASDALAGTFRIRATDGSRSDPGLDQSVRARHFTIASTRLPAVGSVSIRGPDGRDLLGSPVLLGSEQTAARAAAAQLARLMDGGDSTIAGPGSADRWRPLPAAFTPSAAAGIDSGARTLPARAAVDIIIPVYRGAQDFNACLASLLESRNRNGLDRPPVRIVIIDDASPDPELRFAIQRAADAGNAILLRHTRNLGFPSAVNTAVRWSAQHGGARDIVLLNPDTVVPARWLERLAAAAYLAPDIGSVTPITNDGTIVSYPSVLNQKFAGSF
jgi:hypothetical protein